MPSVPSVNLAHLDRLSPRIVVGGTELLATRIYADPPTYDPVDAPGEGIACVDDVARAAVVYLDEYQLTRDPHALRQARAALDFTLRMQEPDGRFTNFITDLQGTINRTGATSRPDLGWWAFRGMWAIARGYRTFQEQDPAYAAQLLGAWARSQDALANEVAKAPGVTSMRGHDVPAWLRRVPADQAGVAVIALAEMAQARPGIASADTRALLGTLAEGIAAARVEPGRDGALGHAAHTIEQPETWHAWGAHQGEALARAGKVLGRADLVEAARHEVEGLAAWELAAGRVHELGPTPVRWGQQAYGVTMAVRGAMALFDATGDRRYARMAGLHASWFGGNNVAREAMYDPSNGRGYDGIDEPPRGVNRSSGAESTIEALMSLQAIRGNADAERFAAMLPVAAPHTWTGVRAETLAAAGAPLVRQPASPAPGASVSSLAELAPGTRVTVPIDLAHGGQHVLLAGHLRQAPGGPGTTLHFSVGGVPAGTLPPTAALGDGPHVALERASGGIMLPAGRHDLVIEAVGPAGATPARLDGLMLHPAIARTELTGSAGDRASISWNLEHGRLGISTH